MSSLLQRRLLVNYFMFSLTAACTLITLLALFGILGYLAWNGGHALRWSFLTNLPTPAGEPGGGIAHAIAGSATLVLLASLAGIPIGLVAAIHLAEFGHTGLASLIRYVADLLNGVPSIVIGIVVYSVVVIPMRNFSVVAGAAALMVILVPAVVRSSEQFLRAVPDTLREGALALGASHWRAVATVIFPAALPGILTAVLLGIARIAGETAPLLFTSFGNQFWNPGLEHPAASLPVVIFTYAISPYADWHQQAWAAALLLLALVVGVNATARLVLAIGQRAQRY